MSQVKGDTITFALSFQILVCKLNFILESQINPKLSTMMRIEIN